MASTVLHSQQRAASGSEAAKPAAASFVCADDLRTAFAAAMSQMYKEEVPLYGDLVRIVSDVNKQVLSSNSKEPPTADRLERLILERHGAIRLGTAIELGIARRIFALMGMHPVGYYDLSVAGLPMHATCFRPISESSLARNPFRIFTSLLRPDLIQSEAAKDLALRLLSERNIFSQDLLGILDIAEYQDNHLDGEQAKIFILEALQTFRWAPVAVATHAEYQLLKEEHPILADIACFKTAHINHLTPRTLDIGRAQQAMLSEHMAVKERIEGPPPRKCPILLRQTSFLAREERVQFRSGDRQATELIDGSHRARFGEIEERGAAVTPGGRAMYDKLLKEASDSAHGLSAEEADGTFKSTFQKFPDTWDELRKNGLVYFKYQWTGKPCDLAIMNIGQSSNEGLLDELITARIVETVPITYEDFLPLSAAGIFQSNLWHGSDLQQGSVDGPSDLIGLEDALGCSVVDADSLYSVARQQSLILCLSKLKKSGSELYTCYLFNDVLEPGATNPDQRCPFVAFELDRKYLLTGDTKGAPEDDGYYESGEEPPLAPFDSDKSDTSNWAPEFAWDKEGGDVPVVLSRTTPKDQTFAPLWESFARASRCSMPKLRTMTVNFGSGTRSCNAPSEALYFTAAQPPTYDFNHLPGCAEFSREHAQEPRWYFAVDEYFDKSWRPPQGLRDELERPDKNGRKGHILLAGGTGQDRDIAVVKELQLIHKTT